MSTAWSRDGAELRLDAAIRTAFLERVGQCVRHLRTERGLTQDDLAALAYTYPKFIYRLENAKGEPGLVHCWQVAEAMHVTLNDLMDIRCTEASSVPYRTYSVCGRRNGPHGIAADRDQARVYPICADLPDLRNLALFYSAVKLCPVHLPEAVDDFLTALHCGYAYGPVLQNGRRQDCQEDGAMI